MVQFGSGYYMPIDREYNMQDQSHGFAPSTEKGTNDVGVNIGDIGFGVALGPTPNMGALAAKVRPGVKTLELAFMGQGKGSGQGHTPGMYGKLQRQALRELQKANQVDFTTHSTVGVMGLAGMDQQGNFSKQNQKMAIDEIKRAIDFAADVAQGGPVVVHTGEFFRPFVDAEWNKDKRFEMYEDEEGRAAFRVVDSRTGGVIQEARKNRKVSRPVWKVTKEGKEYFDFDGRKKIAKSGKDEKGMPIYVDYFGKRLQPEKRVPEFDKENQRFKIKEMGWEDLRKEAEIMTNRAKEIWRDWKSGKISKKDFEKSYWTRFAEAKNEDEIEVKPEEAYIIATLETQAATSRGYASYYGGDFEQNVKDTKKLKKAKEFYQKIQDTIDPKEKWKLKQVARSRFGDLIPADAKYPTEIIEESLKQLRRSMMYSRESSASQWAQAEEAEETIRHVESAEVYALKQAYDAYADAGITAMKQSQRLEKEKKLKKPVAIAMENLFPESYGAHPDELINLVEGGRKAMKERLIKQGIDESKAKKAAEEHIVATFDTGHFNMWRKYWKGDPDKNIEENEKEFNKWALEKIENLAKKKIVGHIHLVDNYGYQDDHLAPGEGNTPVDEMIKIFKKHGYKGEMIVEAGADYNTDVSGFHTLMKTWKHFGAPIHGAVPKATWREVGYGYFGQVQPPYFTVGGYIPSEDWSLWSGVPLE